MDNDYELLYLAKEHNEDAISILYQKYYNLMYRKAKRFSRNFSSSFDDYLNETILAFYNAIDNYQDQNSFKTYLIICIDSALSNYNKSVIRQKNKALNEAISLEDTRLDTAEVITDSRYDPDKIIINDLNYTSFKRKIIDSLTWKEELVFKLYIQNYSTKEISEITDNNIKTVYNIIKRIQNKIVKLMSY